MATVVSTTLGHGRGGLDPVRMPLANGMVLVVKETRSIPAVTINLAMRAGSICDPSDAPGATYLLSRLIDRGTASRSADQIAEELDSRGIALTVNVTRHLFSMVCTCLADDFAPVMALMGDMLIAPVFPVSEIATRKTEVITSIRQDRDNPAVQAVEGLMALLYPDGHPYGRPPKGTVDIIEGFTRERLARLHGERFAPSELSAVVVGAVEASRARDIVERAFGPWLATAPAAEPVAKPVPVPLGRVAQAAGRRKLVIPMMNKAQADIAYGFTTIRRADPTYYATWLMNHVFGQYSMSGRLGRSIRERQGMAYHVRSVLDANIVEGPLIVRAGVSPANVERAVVSIDEEVDLLVRDGVTQKELDDSRQYLTYAMPRSLETNAAIAAFLQNAEFFGLGCDYDVRVQDILRDVSLDAVNEAARDVLDSARATVVIAGPYDGRL